MHSNLNLWAKFVNWERVGSHSQVWRASYHIKSPRGPIMHTGEQLPKWVWWNNLVWEYKHFCCLRSLATIPSELWHNQRHVRTISRLPWLGPLGMRTLYHCQGFYPCLWALSTAKLSSQLGVLCSPTLQLQAKPSLPPPHVPILSTVKNSRYRDCVPFFDIEDANVTACASSSSHFCTIIEKVPLLLFLSHWNFLEMPRETVKP